MCTSFLTGVSDFLGSMEACLKCTWKRRRGLGAEAALTSLRVALGRCAFHLVMVGETLTGTARLRVAQPSPLLGGG